MTFTGLDLEPEDILLFSQAAAAFLAFLACLSATICIVVASLLLQQNIDVWVLIALVLLSGPCAFCSC